MQRLARGESPSDNAMAFAHAVQADSGRPLPDILGQIDPTLEGRFDKNPRVWALLCELLQEGVLDCQCTIYDQEGCQRVALELALLDDDPAAANPAAHEQLGTLLHGYQPLEHDAFIGWLQALKHLRLCAARFNVAVDVSWQPSVEHCRILTARQPDGLAPAGTHAGATGACSPRRACGARNGRCTWMPNWRRCGF